jgi:hypothetical protein
LSLFADSSTLCSFKWRDIRLFPNGRHLYFSLINCDDDDDDDDGEVGGMGKPKYE